MNRKLPTINSKLLAFATFFFIIGISAGVFIVIMIHSEEKEIAMNYFNKYLILNVQDSQLSPEVFLYSMANNLVLLTIIALSGFFSFGLFVSLSTLSYKGLVLGFSTTLILESMGMKGILLILFTVLPQNVFFIFALIFGVVLSVDLKKSPRISRTSYLASYFVLSIIILAGCLLEAFLGPILTRLIL